MSDNKETKKKGFFSRLLGGSDAVDKSNELEKNEVVDGSESLSKGEEALSTHATDDDTNAITVPSKPKANTLSKTALNKMKKADIVSAAAELGLELDIKLTKEKLLESWNAHFNQQEIAEEPVTEAVAEEPVEEIAEEPVAEETAEETQSKPIKIDEQSPAEIIKTFESKQLKDDIPSFRPGDTVVVSVKVREGDRTRLQAFEGVVMNIKNAGLNSAFIVRKISSGIGVERTFQLHSPMIDSISVKRKGDVRQAKLYYLRERSGRSARIKERLD